MTIDEQCECFWTDPKEWYVYYGIAEPGSQMEWNPDCPVHQPRIAAPEDFWIAEKPPTWEQRRDKWRKTAGLA